MAIPCVAGLFVGIDEYDYLPRDRWLLRAAGDASQLGHFFRRAKPPGSLWEVLIDSPIRRPTRLEIVRSITKLIRKVSRDEAGIFYFAGHALETRSGLVLAPVDYRPKLWLDSGLTLRRILDIFKLESKKDKRFVLILDCCRVGARLALADDVPANVCILYGCSSGNEAFEQAGGGLLTQRILKALSHPVNVNVNESNLYCSLHRLYGQIRSQPIDSMSLMASAFDLQGSRTEQLSIPVISSSQDSGLDLQRLPNCSLESRQLSPSELKQLRVSVGKIFAESTGIAFNSLTEAFLSGQNVSSDEDRLTVRLPTDTLHWTSGDFMTSLLERTYNAFENLIVEWSSPVQQDMFKPISSMLPGARGWEILGPSSSKLSWVNKTLIVDAIGHLFVKQLATEGTIVSINSQTIGAERLPLYYLLPTICQLYDRLRLIPIPSKDSHSWRPPPTKNS